MAQFAFVNKDNIVIHVSEVNDNDTFDKNGNISESVGIQYLQFTHKNSIFNGIYNITDLTIIQTDIQGKIRKNYAGIGHTYDNQKDAFISPKPTASAILDQTTLKWIANDTPILIAISINPIKEDIISDNNTDPVKI